MGKIMEAIFCVFYLVFTSIAGIMIIKASKNNSDGRLYGVMTIVLVSGDAFHLVPRILAVINKGVDYSVSLGLGKMVTSITMTVFYVILYFVFMKCYKKENSTLSYVMLGLALVRIVLCLLPQNDWTGLAPVTWGIYRNIPFSIMGIIMVVLYFNQRSDKYYKWMWLAILLSFAFYIPVVLWADLSPMIGMLMLPKTCMYMWIVVMGYRQVKAE